MELSRKHILYDLWVDDPARLKQVEPWRELLSQAAADSGANVLSRHFHQFQPYGVTGILLLAESHLSLHTWPEEGLATVDIFTCGPMDTDLIIDRIRAYLHPRRERFTVVQRGEAD